MSELPKRKPTRLKNFDYSSVGAYFVTICTQDRKRILSEIVKDNSNIVGDGALDVPKVQLTHIGKIVEKYILSTEKIPNVYVDQYVIMPDHLHLIIIIKSGAINSNNACGTSRAPSPTNEMIPRIVSTFKRFCNKDIGYNIFQRSYSEHIIRDQNDYETQRKYIYENPLRWYYKQIDDREN